MTEYNSITVDPRDLNTFQGRYQHRLFCVFSHQKVT